MNCGMIWKFRKSYCFLPFFKLDISTGKQHLLRTMSTPTTERVCVDCSRLMEKKCSSCEKDPLSLIAFVNTNGNVMQDTRSNSLEELARNVLEKLDHQGYCVIDNFHKEEKALAILDEVKNVHERGGMHNGQLTNTLTSENIRGDLIAWLDGREERAENIALHIRRVDALLRELNKMISYHRIEGRTQV